MSWECIEDNKESIARKPHRCDVCDGAIKRGEKQITRAGIESGEGFYRMHMHPECEEFSRKWDNGDWESHTPGDICRNDILKARHARSTEHLMP